MNYKNLARRLASKWRREALADPRITEQTIIRARLRARSLLDPGEYMALVQSPFANHPLLIRLLGFKRGDDAKRINPAKAIYGKPRRKRRTGKRKP